MNLAEYIKEEQKDSNFFWRLSSGEHQNLLDEALEKIEELEKGGAVSSGAANVRQGQDGESGEIISGLVETIKIAYTKIHCGVDNIGWNELSDLLCDALCEAMGDDAFHRWVKEEFPDPK